MRRRGGFTLLEVMVAIVLLAVVLSSLARASTVIAVRGRTNNLATKRMAAINSEANKLGAAPFSTLATWPTGSAAFTRGDFTYTRRLTITAANATKTRYTIKIVVVPTSDPSKADSLTMERTSPPVGSPLCVGC